MSKPMWTWVAALLVVGFVFGWSVAAWTQEKHPQIHAALRALNQAERHLERAEHVYGGHRAKALELVKQAKKELGEALEYAKAHHSGGKAAAPDKRSTTGKSQ